MRKKSLWIPILTLVLVVIGLGLFYERKVSKQEPVPVYKPVEVEREATSKPPPPGETAESGHWHRDEWHSEPHETHEPPAVSAGRSYIPEGAATTPNFPPVDPSEDPVAAAYKRLAYIKNNPYAWGGVHSERATELIAQLMPPPEAIDHGQAEDVLAEMYELTQQDDPRAAEVFAGLLSPTYEGFTADSDVLVEIGPPAVPYILPHLEKGITEGVYIKLAVLETLGRIGERYRSDLGGIVDHIIIPKLVVIATDADNARYDNAAVIYAKEALSRLQ